ncbi:MAG: hypothetical protein NTW78_01915 [Campylobacterales bacterium]|nr:hypothetical protein [Campylobacterales bacterium]
MFEYGDFEFMKATVLFTITLIIFEFARKGTQTKRRTIFIYISIGILSNYFVAAHNQSTAQTNSVVFKKGGVLQCSNDLSKYRVSIKDGWEFEKRYFIKENLMIRADKCEAQK